MARWTIDRVNRLTGHLQQACGVEKGDRVSIYLQNAPQFVAAFYAIVRAGGVAVPINVMNQSSETACIVENAGIRCLVAARELLATVSPLRTSGTLEHVIAVT